MRGVQAVLRRRGSHRTTASSSAATALALAGDVRGIDRLLTREGPGDHGWLWLDAAGHSASLQQQSAKPLLLQIAGGRRVLLAAPGDALFVSLGWWQQIIAPEFSVTIAHDNLVRLNSILRRVLADRNPVTPRA